MILLIILLIPLITAVFLLFLKDKAWVRSIALAATLLNLLLTLYLIFYSPQTEITFSAVNNMGINFSFGYDGISLIMLLLCNLLFPFIILTGFKQEQKQVPLLNFLILFAQSALIGVFLAKNAFLFYIFWELALIPVYFILLLWGGEGRARITLKFFIYTLSGSLFLLFGIIFLYQLTPGMHSTDFSVFNQLQLPAHTQIYLFWILFIAFAIKMPVFPFHTWQPETYTMASTQGVMILAGVMTKMGIYGALRFLFPVVPLGVQYWQNFVVILCLIGVIYASIIAFRQTNFKKLIAFSSMAHISLMTAAMFVLNYYALQGMLFQVISHGVVIVALFYMVYLTEKKTATLELNGMGGLKLVAPNMAILMLIIMLASIALPLTSGFIGEFLMISGLFQQSIWFAVFGGLAMIFSAVYMLYAYQKVMLGDKNKLMENIKDLQFIDYMILIPLIMIILILGIYPNTILNLPDLDVRSMLNHISQINEIVKGF
ncbi:MAG: NADH-quinone oxidoreductase subunit M [Bacteroidetes bacterium]|nr:NADH-quinone oxidoreductase subunit M [Bacteroidota bacterium]